uniref:Homing endonuclease LAGLIDADG domain-containing protein n=1 Tax=Panagrolaimus davidi TaxID=227884 RepID=A0A914Q953_9BILA
MNIDFLIFFVVKRTDIFTDNELRDILWARSGVHGNKLVKNEKIDWYLFYNHNGNRLAIKQRENVYDYHYLLAEMFAEDGFILNTKCKIEIV